MATLDTVIEVPRFPGPDAKVPCSPPSVGGGGPVATALVAAVRMGIPTRVVAAVGDDSRGEQILSGLRTAGVGVDEARRRTGGRSPFSWVVLERGTGRRTIFWHAGDCRPLDPGEVAAGLVEGAAALLVDGHQPEAQRTAVARARAAGVPVILDAGSVRPATVDLLALADHAVVSEPFAVGWVGSAGIPALAALRRAGPAVAVITRGAAGCIGDDGTGPVEVPALPVEARDTNGAGDVFHGAYAAGLLRGLGLDARLRLANAAAGLKCAACGPRRGIPGWDAAARTAGLT